MKTAFQAAVHHVALLDADCVFVMTKLPRSQTFFLAGGGLVVPECCGEEGAQPEGKALPLPLHLHSNRHPLGHGFLASDRKNKIPDRSHRNESPPQGVWAHPQRHSENLNNLQEVQS